MKPDQLSNTAAFIAVKFYGLSRDEPYYSLFDEQVIHFYEQLIPTLPAPVRYYYNGLKYAPLRTFFKFWEELLLPGDLMHIILRKYYLSRWVDDLYNHGYTQMVVLGSGFDHLAPLYAPKGMRCVEFDAPRMTALKKNFITTCGYQHPNLNLQPAFFSRDNLHSLLESQTQLDPSQKTIVIAEGFFDYFSKDQCAEFLHDIDTFFTGELTLLSTLFSLHELSPFRTFVYENSIKMAGEELKLGLDKDAFDGFLKTQGFNTKLLLNTAKMREDVLVPHHISYPILKGFYLLKAKR